MTKTVVGLYSCPGHILNVAKGLILTETQRWQIRKKSYNIHLDSTGMTGKKKKKTLTGKNLHPSNNKYVTEKVKKPQVHRKITQEFAFSCLVTIEDA